MIKILKYGEVANNDIFARVTPTVNVEEIVADIIANVRKNGDKALYCFAGCKWGNTAGNPNNNTLDIAAIWSNSNGKDEGRAYNMMFRWKDQPTDKKGWTKVSFRALGFPVRCMKDTENR